METNEKTPNHTGDAENGNVVKETGIVYLMTTAVDGIIKIGSTGDYETRMQLLEKHGFNNITGLRRYFAIELKDYQTKESLLHEIFDKHRIADSEFFAVDPELVKQLLLAFEGKVIYPKTEDKEKEFNKVTEEREKDKENRQRSELFNFYKKGLKNGDKILFIKDTRYEATVIGEREVEFEGQIWKLSPLVRELYKRMGKSDADSRQYQGPAFFTYNGTKLTDLPDKY